LSAKETPLIRGQWLSTDKDGLPKDQEKIVIRLRSGVKAFGINSLGVFCSYDLAADRMVEFHPFSVLGKTDYLYLPPNE